MKKLWETLKTMSFKEAVDYIWEYYKLHIIGTVLGVAFLISILSTVFKDKEESYEVMVVSEIPYEITEQFSNQMNEKYFDDFKVTVNNITSGGGSISDMSYADIQKFWANIGANMVDIIVTNEAIAEQMVEQEGILQVEEVVDMSLIEENGVEIYDFGTENSYGMDSNQLDVFDDVELFQDKVLIVPVNSENHERTTQFLETLIES
ncbi:hypothetical protein SAMN04487943_1026 [Gracilibacillus orientalis]|uniref:Extracellular solute-binding protein n=1 Tax=Gracilibacillus orientalis TaxID=334253 RepID=A0A1I4IAZ0_9BACI|nr:hypothetical protein [Gracilibacillus orientalis]SFL51464.1 hypothetical protein SAMN04487943_1026 [Gracilibacillus orientalis]